MPQCLQNDHFGLEAGAGCRPSPELGDHEVVQRPQWGREMAQQRMASSRAEDDETGHAAVRDGP